MRRKGARSFARCAGDAGRRPALHCRARFGRVIGTRFRGPRGPRNPHAAVHARQTPPTRTTTPLHTNRVRQRSAGLRPASRPQAAKLPALWRPVAGTRHEDGEATYARRRRRAVLFGEGAMRRKGVRSFARCAGDAGRRPALRCRARWVSGSVVVVPVWRPAFPEGRRPRRRPMSGTGGQKLTSSSMPIVLGSPARPRALKIGAVGCHAWRRYASSRRFRPKAKTPKLPRW